MELIEKAGEAIEPYILSAVQSYLATDAGRKRVGELVDAMMRAMIRRLDGAQ
jgi:hypothetical protein